MLMVNWHLRWFCKINNWFKEIVQHSLLVLQKRVLRLRHFSEPRAHAVSLFITSNILAINMLNVETVSSLTVERAIGTLRV